MGSGFDFFGSIFSPSLPPAPHCGKANKRTAVQMSNMGEMGGNGEQNGKKSRTRN